MRLPEAVIFDYGHTLVYEEYFNTTKGGEAMYKHISRNGSGVSEEEFVCFSDKLYEDLSHARRQLALEVPATSFTRIIREYFDVDFDMDEVLLQELFWDGISPPVKMPDADKMLHLLTDMGIRTAVVSNLWYEAEVLKRRINRLLPGNGIEFFMSTSDYGFRKPSRLLFEIALGKLGMSAENVWYCGDEPEADIKGAYDAGIMPIWFNPDIACPYKFKAQGLPTNAHIEVKSWSEFMQMLVSLREQTA